MHIIGKEEQACCEHIVTNIDLKWELPDCSGKATLQGIRLTAPMVQLVTVSPIHWGKIRIFTSRKKALHCKNCKLNSI